MKVLILGAKGMLGEELQKQLQQLGHEVHAFDRELDITNPEAVQAKVLELKPDLIFNCAAYNAMDKAEDEPEFAKKLNADAVGNVTRAAKSVGAITVQYSTGYVFDGENSQGYSENAQPDPQSVYAKTKFEGEQQLQANTDKFYLIRLNLLFGAQGQSEGSKKSFPALILDLAKTKDSFDFVTDEISTPTYAPDLARASIALITEKYPFGIYHLVNDGSASWYDWAKCIFELKGVSAKVNEITGDKMVRKAKRPHCSVLINTKFPKLRSWQEATAEFIKEN